MSEARALRFVNLGHFLDHFFMLVFPTAVLALHRVWDMSYAAALALGTPAFVAFAAGTVPAGWLGDRWGAHRMMPLFFLSLGGGALATGLAVGPVSLALGLTALGLAASIYHPVATALLVRLCERPGRALGVNGVYGNLGVAAAPVVTGTLVGWLGWRAAFLVPGVAALLVGAAARSVFARVGEARACRPRPRAQPGERARVIGVVAVSALLGGLIFHGVTIALPKLFEERLDGARLPQVGALAAGVFALASLAQIPVGRLLDRVGARAILLAAAGLQVPLLLATAAAPGWGSVLAAAALVPLVFGEIPVAAWLVGRYVGEDWHSRAYALQFLLSLGVSAGAVPLIAVLHQRTGGSGALFVTLAGAAALVFAAAWALPPARKPVFAADPAP